MRAARPRPPHRPEDKAAFVPQDSAGAKRVVGTCTVSAVCSLETSLKHFCRILLSELLLNTHCLQWRVQPGSGTGTFWGAQGSLPWADEGGDGAAGAPDHRCPSRLSEPDPSHTLEERVVHWYFKLLDKNSSGDIGKKEIKPFKRFLRKKSKPKKCVKKFVEYCDANNNKSLSVHELMGCLGVTREEAKAGSRKRHSKSVPSLPLATGLSVGRPQIRGRPKVRGRGSWVPAGHLSTEQGETPGAPGRRERGDRHGAEDVSLLPLRRMPVQRWRPQCLRPCPGPVGDDRLALRVARSPRRQPG